MYDPKKPFFYDRRKSSGKKKLLFFLFITVIIIFWGSKIPVIRQAVSSQFLEVFSYGRNLFKPVSTPDPYSYRIPTQFATPDLPSEDVLNANGLEDLSLNQQELVYEDTPTPTPGIAWVYRPTEFVFTGSDSELSATQAVTIEPPVFERADYQNDGPAILSAVLRLLHKNESQYLIATRIKPDYLSPSTTFEEMADYISETYSDLGTMIRINGSNEIIKNLISMNVPVILRIERKKVIPEWRGDDNLILRYILVTGFDEGTKVFYYEDPLLSSHETISFDDLMKDWYAFSRKFMTVYPLDSEDIVRNAMMSSQDEETNQNEAMDKFKNDSELGKDNVYTWLNYGKICLKTGKINDAWNAFQEADQLGIPQRTWLYDNSYMQTAYDLGRTDILDLEGNYLLQLNSHNADAWFWLGWSSVLKGEKEKAVKYFRKVKEIQPNFPKIDYALKYLEQY